MSFEPTDQYIIRQKIGEGGMGVVYLAEDTALERPVAIKELSRQAIAGPDATEHRFQQEALALARLNHPNITHLYAFLPKGETYWMVMEYVPGKTLEEWLHYRGQMPAGLACSIVVQMLEGLHHAHRKGIIHRDLKPGNVMISEEGEVKIMDFGIARIRDSQRITRHGKSVGTLAYMAPEQIRGEEGDERTDIYAAGNILYELLSGHTPFEADTDYHLMKLKLEEQPRPVAAAANIPAELQKVMQKALDRNPAKRYETVAALREAIEHSMQGRLLKAEVLNARLSDLQQEEEFVQAVRENPLRNFSGRIKALPLRTAASKLSGNLKQLSASGHNRAWWLLGASLLVCISLLAWSFAHNGDSAPQDKQAADTEQAIAPTDHPGPDSIATASKPQPSIIENQLVQNELNQRTFSDKKEPDAGRQEAVHEDKPEHAIKKTAPPERKAGKETDNAGYSYNRRADPPEEDHSERSYRNAGPVEVPAGRSIRVVLDDNLSSEAEELDGSQVRLHCDESVVVDGRVVIRKGASVTGKIVDVRSSSNPRRGAIIGFVIQHIEASDGTTLKLRSERFRNEADSRGQPVYFRRGQSFTAELKGGRLY